MKKKIFLHNSPRHEQTPVEALRCGRNAVSHSQPARPLAWWPTSPLPVSPRPPPSLVGLLSNTPQGVFNYGHRDRKRNNVMQINDRIPMCVCVCVRVCTLHRYYTSIFFLSVLFGTFQRMHSVLTGIEVARLHSTDGNAPRPHLLPGGPQRGTRTGPKRDRNKLVTLIIIRKSDFTHTLFVIINCPT